MYRIHVDYITVSLQEIPNEISLIIPLSGCGCHCKGCHTSIYRDANSGELVSLLDYITLLEKYRGKCSCICFFEGRGVEDLAYVAKELGFKIALYSGKSYVDYDIPFDYLKVGEYKEELGGLRERTTNQRMYKLQEDGSYKCITKEFWR
jgi:anaerobic ribonucleoside-triphosphate reductase activating protein